jgi:hypothetical protein
MINSPHHPANAVAIGAADMGRPPITQTLTLPDRDGNGSTAASFDTSAAGCWSGA